ncbi:shikimate kinase [Thermovibrio sp.]
MKKLVLIGFMGSGKSTIGELLSRKTGFKFLDLDWEIVKREGKEIAQIFKERGEKAFRKVEREVLKELLERKENLIIATGGGTPAYENNIELINSKGTSIFLKTDFETLWKRISNDEKRPLVKLGKEKVKELYLKRLSFYERAELKVECEGKGPEEVAREITSKLSLNGATDRTSPKGQEGQT